MKDILPLAVIGLVAYFVFKGGGAGSLSSILSNAVSSLPAQAFEPGQYTGPPAGINPMEGASTPEAQIAAQQAINSGAVGNVPQDTQLVFASYDRHWANQLASSVHLTVDQWNGYRARYVAQYGGEDPSPNLSLVVPAGTYLTAPDYLSAVNAYRALIGKASLGCLPGLGCTECAGTCGGNGMGGWA